MACNMAAQSFGGGSEFKDPSQFVLKAAGFNAFLLGDVPMNKYAYVRLSLREQHKEIKLVLMLKPDLEEPEDEEDKMAYRLEYQQKLNLNAQIPSMEERARGKTLLQTLTPS